MKTTTDYDDWLDYYTELRIKSIEKKSHTSQTDEEILEKMDLKTIENFLRKKKLNNIKNNKK